MTRRLALCFTIVAAFHAVGARSALSEDVPVPGGMAALAQALDIDPVPDRSRFIAELTRLQLDPLRIKTLVAAASRPDSANLIPVPLAAAIWEKAVFHHPTSAGTLVGAILSDHHAALLCHGLTALDDETLEFLGSHPSLLSRLYENNAPVFAAFAGSLRIHAGRIVPPGGAAAAPIWEAVLGARLDQPERFVRELFERGDGRVAYLYDVIAQLEPAKAAFALGLSIDRPASRVERFQKLVASTINAQREWRVRTFPFARPLYDIASILARIRTDDAGRPVLASARLWTSVFAGGEPGGDPVSLPNGAHDGGPIDAAWLAEMIASRDVREREDRSDQFAFAQRVFGGAADAALPSVITAVRAFPRMRMLMLTFERIGIVNPAVYADAAKRMSRVSALEPNRGFVAHAQFQGALALVARMARVRTIDTATAESLVSSLILVPLNDDGRYAGAMTRWIRETLQPALAPSDSIDSAILIALAGKPLDVGAGRPPPTLVAWEGKQYRLDLAASELRRLRRIRDKQNALPVDVPVALGGAAATLAREHVAAADAAAAIATLKTIAGDFSPVPRSEREMQPPGVDAPRSPHDVLERVLKDLAKLDPAKDAARMAHDAQPLEELADTLLAEALLSLAYAVDIGDPDGTALLAGNVARRHDFGFGMRDSVLRQRVAWNLPKQDLAPGLPWHVTGSLLGLDVALAPLGLRRLSTDPIAAAPKLTSNERETFAISVALMDPLALRNADVAAIAGAIERGRRRLAALTAGSFDEAAAEIAMDGWRRRAVRWTLAHDPALVPSMFSLTEMLRLGGGPAPASLDAWGMGAYTSDGCLCTKLTEAGRWSLWIGRPQLGLMATGVADLNLHVAVMLHELKLPALLARHVLTAAVQDFIDQVRPTDAYDWLTLVRAAQQVSRERVEDYVASAAADGPLMLQPSGSDR